MENLKAFNDIRNDVKGVLGVGLKYSYNSIVGPVEFDVHWSNLRNRAGAYFNIGLYF